MRFDLAKSAIKLVLCAGFFAGCTEKLPLTPVYTTDADWTPVISLYANGYQRVALLIDRPTRKELWRNISFLALQAKSSQQTSYSDVDTIQGAAAAPVESYGMPVRLLFQSKPRLSFSTDYTFRVAAHFVVGENRFSNELSVRTPPSVGKVLKRLRFPEGFYPSFQFLCFHQGSLIAFQYGQVIRVDTASGKITTIKYDFRPPYYSSNSLPAFTVIGDTAYSFYPEDNDYRKNRLVSLDLKTLRVDSSIRIADSRQLETIVSHQGKLYGIWITASYNWQAGIISTRTGEVVERFSEGPRYNNYPLNLASDGISLFVNNSQTFDSRIVAIDPTGMNSVQENRNPIFASVCLAWDGEYFWVLDVETATLAKIKLEGM